MADADFTFVASGGEGTDFDVALPVARPDNAYYVSASLSKVASAFAIDLPKDRRTTNRFGVSTTAPVQAGLAEGTAKRRVLIFNVSPGPQIIFTANSGAAGNQIFGPANTEIPVFPGSGRVFWYDATSPPGVWRLTERL